MVSLPISHRVLMKVLLCGFVLAFTCVGVGGITDESIDAAVQMATASLQREMIVLKEQLELFEMKHETLQAASEQFRLQSKNAKKKLEEERSRYDILASQKQSIESNIESKLAIALEDQKANYEETVTAEYIAKRDLLLKENEELSENLRHTESQLQTLEERMKKTMEEQSKRSEISEGRRLASEEKMRTQIEDLKTRLSLSDKQAKSFEESWKTAVTESEAKDEYFQLESQKRLKEASRWEERLQELNIESQELFADNKAKELELLRSKKLHLTLLEKLQDSEEAVKEHEEKIETFTANRDKLSNDLNFVSIELEQSKEDHASLSDRFENLNNLHEDTELILKRARAESTRTAAKNEKLQNELVDLKFELETSQNKTKQTIEEKSEMTKSYTEALEQLTVKNKVLRRDLVDIKFEFEENQNETVALRKKYFDATKAHEEALDRLDSEQKKLEFLESEYFTLTKNMVTMTDQFNESEIKAKKFQKRIEDQATTNEVLQRELLYAELKVESSDKNIKQLDEKNSELSTMYEQVKISLESSEAKVLEAKRQYQRSQEYVDILQESLLELEQKVEEMIDNLKARDAKNSYLQKSLLDTKSELEESQIKVDSLEAQLAKKLTKGEQFGDLEIANDLMLERAKDLERRLGESNTLYNNATRKISDLQSQLNVTETRSAQILNMFESIKEENNILSRSLLASDEYKDEFHAASEALEEKSESFEQCGNDLRDTRVEYFKLKEDYDTAREKIDKTEEKVLVQEDAIKELKIRQLELENIADEREKKLEEIEKSISSEIVDSRNGDMADVKSDSIEATAVVEEIEGEKKEREDERTKDASKNQIAEAEDPANDGNDIPVAENERKSQKWSRKSFFSFLGWLDYTLYTILRVIVDLVGFFANSVWQIFSSSSLFAPMRSLFDVASWTMNELRVIHSALVSLFEFEMTFVSSLVSSEKDRSGFVFLIRHSEIFVMVGEAIGVLLCIDFIVSSFLNPIRARKRRPRAKTIPVPKTATASLLRKANNM
eukprot:CAMPEP_0197188544 /NCGR_PEP_ID=MMETSP1423-20130617/17975_1 /TAXON_ID=476441 /ORGANISM="Pseudo-nitzschia heimii, Strain UNC1101" /LENGTH=1015 /DNA_ID=CAMNT_0042640399 /DNA_START=82 /DNA_END=3129 /DNA_ORIENTATION=-